MKAQPILRACCDLLLEEWLHTATELDGTVTAQWPALLGKDRPFILLGRGRAEPASLA